MLKKISRKRYFQAVELVTGVVGSEIRHSVALPVDIREHEVRINKLIVNGGFQTGVNKTASFVTGQAFFGDWPNNVKMLSSNSFNIIANTNTDMELDYSISVTELTINLASAFYCNTPVIATDNFYITYTLEYEILLDS